MVKKQHTELATIAGDGEVGLEAGGKPVLVQSEIPLSTDGSSPFNVGGPSYNRLRRGQPVNGCQWTGRDLKTRITELEVQVRKNVDVVNQITGERFDYIQLVTGLLAQDEILNKSAELHCSSITSSLLSDETHYGAIVLLSNERIFFVDTKPARYSTFAEVVKDVKNPRERFFDVSNLTSDDVWIYPIPISNITGLSLHRRESAKCEAQLVKTKPQWPWLAALFLSVLLIGLGVGTSAIDDDAFSDAAVYGYWAAGLIFFCLSMYLRSHLNQYEDDMYPVIQIRNRSITLGCMDPIRQVQAVWALEIDLDVSIVNALEFFREVEKVRYSFTAVQQDMQRAVTRASYPANTSTADGTY